MATPPEEFGHYQILQPLGEGGMGKVFLARDTLLDRKVALKFLSDRFEQDPSIRERFLREARAAAQLDHPFICKVYEAGEIEGRLFIAMEYVEGVTLAERLRSGALDLEDACQIALEVAEALEVAHGHNIVHRDLKPANVMLTSRHAKVMDFGLAKFVLPESAIGSATTTLSAETLTEAGATLGTLAYMSPEQAQGRPVDARSDLFSFGVLLHEMLTGQHPFQRTSALETVSAILRDDPPAVRLAARRAPPGLEGILRHTLAKKPEDRYKTATQLADDLRALRQSLVRRASRWPLLAVAAAVAVIGASAWLALRGRQPAQVAEPSRVSILIADFDNQTGDELFSGVLERAASIVLEDASFVTPFKREAALRAAQTIRPNATVLDHELAQLVAQREGLNRVISGEIRNDSSQYVISMTALDPASGEIVGHHEARTQSKEEVLPLVGRLAGKTRESLGDTNPEAIHRAAEESFTATTLEAAHAYVQAQDLLTAGKYQEAIDAFSELVKAYPEMGRAYAGIAVGLANMNRLEEAAEYYEQAMAHIDQMTEREKGRTRGTYYLMTRNYMKATEVYEQLVRSYPYDEAARVNLVLAYYYARQMDAALTAAREAVKVVPYSAIAQANLALVALYAGDFVTAEAQTKVVLQAHPNYETVHVGLSLAQLALNKVEEARTSYERLSKISTWGASLAAAGLADLQLYLGHWGDAAAILTTAAAIDLKAGDSSAEARKLTALAQAELSRGRPVEALLAARQAVAANQQDPVLFEAARIHLGAGDHAGATKLGARLAQRLAPEPRVYAQLIEGEIALARGEPSRAVSLFTEAQSMLDTWLGRFDLGLAYLDSHAYAEAHAEFEAALERRGEAASVFLDDLPTYHYLPPVYYYMGRAQEGLGSAKAKESYERFLELRSQSDDDPLVLDARERLQAR